jgi:hypothetical protein
MAYASVLKLIVSKCEVNHWSAQHCWTSNKFNLLFLARGNPARPRAGGYVPSCATVGSIRILLDGMEEMYLSRSMASARVPWIPFFDSMTASTNERRPGSLSVK